jgi:hypothetical protein
MCAGSGEDYFIRKRTVNQYPVRFDMAFTETFFIAVERMIFVFWVGQVSFTEQVNHFHELIQVIMTLFGQFDVFFERIGESDFAQS